MTVNTKLIYIYIYKKVFTLQKSIPTKYNLDISRTNQNIYILITFFKEFIIWKLFSYISNYLYVGRYVDISSRRMII
jgi:hypothetical protein